MIFIRLMNGDRGSTIEKQQLVPKCLSIFALNFYRFDEDPLALLSPDDSFVEEGPSEALASWMSLSSFFSLIDFCFGRV